MKRFFSLLVTALAVTAVAVPLVQTANASPPEPTVPSDIAVLEGNKLFLVGHAVGVQIYSCNLTAGQYSWTLVAPRANLYGDNGKLVATHFGGPTWQATDGSYVVGRVEKRVPVAGTIPWLRLAADQQVAGLDGDRLAGTTFIQRINTTGGVAPAAADCNALTINTTSEIDYTADYYFWKPTGA